MTKLYESHREEGSFNDPYMINPRGAKVQVPESRVADLLKQGFTLMDRRWKPTSYEDDVTPVPETHKPSPVKVDITKEEVDLLEVTEI